MKEEYASNFPEYEFDTPQADIIRSLARKMGAVGFLILFLGVLQILHGLVSAYTGLRKPDQLLKVAKEQLPAEQFEKFEKTIVGGGMSPFVVIGLAIAAAGLLHFLFGLWTQQSAASFASVAETRGKDITRLMEALRYLNKAYGLVYSLIMIAAIAFFISFLFSLFSGAHV